MSSRLNEQRKQRLLALREKAGSPMPHKHVFVGGSPASTRSRNSAARKAASGGGTQRSSQSGATDDPVRTRRKVATPVPRLDLSKTGGGPPTNPPPEEDDIMARIAAQNEEVETGRYTPDANPRAVTPVQPVRKIVHRDSPARASSRNTTLEGRSRGSNNNSNMRTANLPARATSATPTSDSFFLGGSEPTKQSRVRAGVQLQRGGGTQSALTWQSPPAPMPRRVNPSRPADTCQLGRKESALSYEDEVRAQRQAHREMEKKNAEYLRMQAEDARRRKEEERKFAMTPAPGEDRLRDAQEREQRRRQEERKRADKEVALHAEARVREAAKRKEFEKQAKLLAGSKTEELILSTNATEEDKLLQSKEVRAKLQKERRTMLEEDRRIKAKQRAEAEAEERRLREEAEEVAEREERNRNERLASHARRYGYARMHAGEEDVAAEQRRRDKANEYDRQIAERAERQAMELEAQAIEDEKRKQERTKQKEKEMAAFLKEQQKMKEEERKRQLMEDRRQGDKIRRAAAQEEEQAAEERRKRIVGQEKMKHELDQHRKLTTGIF